MDWASQAEDGTLAYEYRGLKAQTWDLFRDPCEWDDLAFYRQTIQEFGEPVLDVGCGTGRLLLEFRRLGLDADGVDVSPEMLELCRSKADGAAIAIRTYLQDMRQLSLPRRYRTVLVPSSSFQLLTQPDDAAAAMSSLFSVLEQGGSLIMPFVNPSSRRSTTNGVDWALTCERTLPNAQLTYQLWTKQWFDHKRQLEHIENRFDVLRDGQLHEREYCRRSPATRWYTRAQARALYRRAGFKVVRLTSGFTNRPAGPADPLFCIVGNRPG